MVKFRAVILNDVDEVIDVVLKSKQYDNPDDFVTEGGKHEMLCELHRRYNLNDYEQCPCLEIQIWVNNIWKEYSDPIVDWFEDRY